MKSFQRLLAAAPALTLLPTGALANPADLNLEGVNKYVSTQGQSTSIRQFSDVYPTDWAYQALSKLVETYGCVSGFPDGTFRGNEPVTRFQMAALLASCLEKVSMSGMEMSDEMKAVVASLETELITVQGEVDSLKAKVTELEGMDYSPAVKVSLSAQYDFLMAGAGDDNDMAKRPEVKEDKDAGVKPVKAVKKDTSGLVSGHAAKLKFSGSANGADKLTLAVKYSLLPSFGDYFADGYFTYGNDSDIQNLKVDDLIYSYPLHLGGLKAKVYSGTIKDDDVLEGIETYYGGGGHDDYGVGGEGGAGAGAVIPFSDYLTLSAAYTVGKPDAGLFADHKGLLGGDSKSYISTALTLSSDVIMGNEAFVTGWYRYGSNSGGLKINSNRFTFVGGVYLTEDISVSGTYSFNTIKHEKDERLLCGSENKKECNTNKWMFAANWDNALFEGNSAGLAYGIPEVASKNSKDFKLPSVLEIYYTWKVNDHFEIPVYIDFINNNLGKEKTSGWAFGVRPSYSF